MRKNVAILVAAITMCFFLAGNIFAYDPPYLLPYNDGDHVYTQFISFFDGDDTPFGSQWYIGGNCLNLSYMQNVSVASTSSIEFCGGFYKTRHKTGYTTWSDWSYGNDPFGTSAGVSLSYIQQGYLHSSMDVVYGGGTVPGTPYSCGENNINNCDIAMAADVATSVSFNVTIEPVSSGTVTVNNEACQSCPCEFSVPSGQDATVYVEPNEGYDFVRYEWNDGGSSSTANPETFTVTEAMSVTAVSYLKADDFVYPVLADGVTDPLQNKTNPIGNGWAGHGVGEHSAEDGHLGQDYYVPGVNSAGKPVYAVANGIIVEVMNNPNYTYGWCDDSDHGWGPVVVIKHENHSGFDPANSIVTYACDTQTNPTVVYSLYGHLSKESIQNLHVGQVVMKGEQIGVLGAPGIDWSYALNMSDHLHFELKDEVGFNEKAWYKYHAGQCPGTESQSCDAEGVGTGYSYSVGFAPHRYIPSIFIPNNEQ